MAIVGLVLGSIAVILLWPTRSRAVTLAAGIGAVALCLLLAGLVSWVQAMPRAMTALSGQKLAAPPRPLVVRDDELLLLGENELLSVRLPSGRIDARLEGDGKGRRFVVSAVSARSAVVLSYLRGSLAKGWAFVPRDRSRVDWHDVVNDRPPPRPYWDAERDRFVVVEEHALGSEGMTELVLTPVDLDGRSAAPERFQVAVRELPVNAALCAIRDQLYAAGRDRVCLFGPADEHGVRRCVPQPIRAECPGTLDGDPSLGWLGPSGPAAAPALPSVLGEGKLGGRYVLASESGMRPGAEWVGADLELLFAPGDVIVRIDRAAPRESDRAGHMREEHASIELFTPAGDWLGRSYVLRPPPHWLVARSGSELVLLSAMLDSVARFDRERLARVDPPDVEPALDRLSIWRGRSRLYELSLGAISLGGALWALVLAAFGSRRIRREERAWTLLRRGSAILAASALLVLLLTAQRIWYL